MWGTAQLAVIRAMLSSSALGTHLLVLSHVISVTTLQSRNYHLIILKLKQGNGIFHGVFILTNSLHPPTTLGTKRKMYKEAKLHREYVIFPRFSSGKLQTEIQIQVLISGSKCKCCSLGVIIFHRTIKYNQIKRKVNPGKLLS